MSNDKDAHSQTLSHTLSTEHAQCDAMFEAVEHAVGIEDWEQACSHFRAFESAHARHLKIEENIIFPAFENATNNYIGPTAVMRTEHARLCTLIDGMHEALINCDQDAFFDQADLFRVMNHQHNKKEESVLYAMADRVLREQVPALIEAVLRVDLERQRQHDSERFIQ